MILLFFTEYKVVSNWWSWEGPGEHRKCIGISVDNSLVWWQDFLQRVKSVADSLSGSVLQLWMHQLIW